MKFSYRHPDLADKEATRPTLSEQEAATLLERRRVVREIPAPAAVERSDEESWALWVSITDGRDSAHH